MGAVAGGPGRGLGPLNQADRKAQFAAQGMFFGRHLTMVAFMVVAAEVEKPVQNQNFYFSSEGMSKRSGITGCDLGGDGDVSGQIRNMLRGWK